MCDLFAAYGFYEVFWIEDWSRTNVHPMSKAGIRVMKAALNTMEPECIMMDSGVILKTEGKVRAYIKRT